MIPKDLARVTCKCTGVLQLVLWRPPPTVPVEATLTRGRRLDQQVTGSGLIGVAQFRKSVERHKMAGPAQVHLQMLFAICMQPEMGSELALVSHALCGNLMGTCRVPLHWGS
jgi:hypothetical protein